MAWWVIYMQIYEVILRLLSPTYLSRCSNSKLPCLQCTYSTKKCFGHPNGHCSEKSLIVFHNGMKGNLYEKLGVILMVFYNGMVSSNLYKNLGG